MGAPAPKHDAKDPDSAVSVTEAKEKKSSKLQLRGLKLSAVPGDIHGLKHLNSLDLSENPLKQITNSCFPRGLQELSLTGCELKSLPSCLAELTGLQRIFCGSNRIQDVDVVFKLPSLQHAGLSYNCIQSLPKSLLLSCQLLSIDLSHNNLCDLTATMSQLKVLPALANLSLQGNPMCLLPSYQGTVRSSFPKLMYLEGMKLDSLGAGSRPASVATPPPPMLTSSSGALLPAGVDTYLELELTELRLKEDPYALVKEAYARAQQAIQDAAAAGQPPPEPVRFPPLHPTHYHFELIDCEGTAYGSVALKVMPPELVPVTPAEGAKGPAKAEVKKTPPAKAGAKGGKGAPATPEPQELKLVQGRLRVLLPLNASVAWRDWLRSGFEVKLYRTKRTSVARPQPPPSPELQQEPPRTPVGGKTGAAANKGKAGKKGAEEPAPDLAQYDVVEKQECIGQARVQPGSLVDGRTYRYVDNLALLPPPALWSGSGIRMALKDPCHPGQPVADVQARLQLHAMPESVILASQ
mmetsp:Transcript_12366/g.26720  ORF Transcript_12366/g.26720 Transcript_12366/m.26720 type:complete len:523 (+) Transcript_12366:37-1605(+)